MKRPVKIILIILAVLVVLVGAAYGAGAFFFSQHVFPNTEVGSKDVSMDSERQLKSDINSVATNYDLTIEGEGFSYKLDSSKVNMTIDSGALAKSIIEDQDFLMWPMEVFSSHELSDVIAVEYDAEALKSIIDNQVDIYNRGKTKSENATPVYDKDKGTYVVKEEVLGDAFDAELVFAKVNYSVKALDEKCTLTTDELARPEVTSDDEGLTAAVETANEIVSGTIDLTVDGEDDPVATVGKDQIVSWLTFNKKLKPKIDTDAVAEWVEKVTKDLNTVGTKRKWKRADGTKCTVEGGSYGWKVDATSLADKIGDQLKKADFAAIEVECSKKAAQYQGAGKRDWKSYVDVDLSEQHVYYYDDNDKLLYETDCVTGTKGSHDTPTGVYTMDWKQSPRILKGTNDDGSKYETRVTYWMPFIDARGIGLHDASWRSNFGGSIYKSNGSHGCVNLPSKSAKWFYEHLEKGTVIIVHE